MPIILSNPVVSTLSKAQEQATASSPAAAATGSIASFFGFLGDTVKAVAPVLVGNQLAIAQARTDAKVQALLNQNHAVNPATGPNDPNAALKAADKTFLEKFLPTSMLYNTDSLGNKTPAFGYYAIMGIILLIGVLFVKRILR